MKYKEAIEAKAKADKIENDNDKARQEAENAKKSSELLKK